MNIPLSLQVLTLSALLALSSAANATVSAAPSLGAPTVQAKPSDTVAKSSKAKPKKSKQRVRLNATAATLTSSAAVAPAAFNSAASIALSPVVNPAVVPALPDQPAAVRPESASSSLAIATDLASQSYDEESSLEQHERFTGAVSDSDALGQESVSVVDRFADKPKAKPISEGPLRVKVKDSGVRASVQIPLTQVLQ